MQLNLCCCDQCTCLDQLGFTSTLHANWMYKVQDRVHSATMSLQVLNICYHHSHSL
jgi:hypothetical protein